MGIGLVAAVPALFLATRVVPFESPDRMAVEETVFFAAWGLAAAAALLMPSALTSARWLTALAGLGCLAVPVANDAGTGAWPRVSAAQEHRIALAVDVAFPPRAEASRRCARSFNAAPST